VHNYITSVLNTESRISQMSVDLAVHGLVRLSRTRIGAGPIARVQKIIGDIGACGPPKQRQPFHFHM
jgi:hypothetical protein